MTSYWQIIKTQDNSTTIKSSLFGETYHSVNGAISESLHVFIKNGLAEIKQTKLKVLEVGFGSGLNAILSFDYASKNNFMVEYHSIEKYPLSIEVLQDFVIPQDLRESFNKMHEFEWNVKNKLSDNFTILKIEADFVNWTPVEKYDLIYFDAFSFNTQPEMWSEDVFIKIFKACNKNAIFVTYSAKGIVKRNLRTAGFIVTRIPGFKKHHIIRAYKN